MPARAAVTATSTLYVRTTGFAKFVKPPYPEPRYCPPPGVWITSFFSPAFQAAVAKIGSRKATMRPITRTPFEWRSRIADGRS
jgi:hypothetical protein